MQLDQHHTSITMLRTIVLLCAFVAINAHYRDVVHRHMNIRSIFPNGKIVGGKPVTIDQVPWQVALEDSGFLFCGGSIISANYVLTAAHCTDGSRPKDITIRYGTDQLEDGGKTAAVGEIFQNDKFNFSELDYDVSVLKLSAPLTLSASAKAISLRSAEAASGETANVSGWGTLSSGGGSLPSNLQAVDVPVVSRDECNTAYDGDITDRMICAGEEGKDSCQGDSGGAITIRGAQVGIVSWGYGCAEAGYPGVYSNVAALADYIKTNSNNEATWV